MTKDMIAELTPKGKLLFEFFSEVEDLSKSESERFEGIIIGTKMAKKNLQILKAEVSEQSQISGN